MQADHYRLRNRPEQLNRIYAWIPDPAMHAGIGSDWVRLRAINIKTGELDISYLSKAPSRSPSNRPESAAQSDIRRPVRTHRASARQVETMAASVGTRDEHQIQGDGQTPDGKEEVGRARGAGKQVSEALTTPRRCPWHKGACRKGGKSGRAANFATMPSEARQNRKQEAHTREDIPNEQRKPTANPPCYSGGTPAESSCLHIHHHHYWLLSDTDQQRIRVKHSNAADIRAPKKHLMVMRDRDHHVQFVRYPDEADTEAMAERSREPKAPTRPRHRYHVS